MEIAKITSISNVHINKNLNQQNKKKQKKEGKNLSFSEVLKSVSH